MKILMISILVSIKCLGMFFDPDSHNASADMPSAAGYDHEVYLRLHNLETSTANMERSIAAIDRILNEMHARLAQEAKNAAQIAELKEWISSLALKVQNPLIVAQEQVINRQRLQIEALERNVEILMQKDQERDARAHQRYVQKVQAQARARSETSVATAATATAGERCQSEPNPNTNRASSVAGIGRLSRLPN